MARLTLTIADDLAARLDAQVARTGRSRHALVAEALEMLLPVERTFTKAAPPRLDRTPRGQESRGRGPHGEDCPCMSCRVGHQLVRVKVILHSDTADHVDEVATVEGVPQGEVLRRMVRLGLPSVREGEGHGPRCLCHGCRRTESQDTEEMRVRVTREMRDAVDRAAKRLGCAV